MTGCVMVCNNMNWTSKKASCIIVSWNDFVLFHGMKYKPESDSEIFRLDETWGRGQVTFLKGQENVHFKVAGFICLWFLNGLGASGRAKLHFWGSNPLQGQENVHFKVAGFIFLWFLVLGACGRGKLHFWSSNPLQRNHRKIKPATLECIFSWPCMRLELQKCNLALPQAPKPLRNHRKIEPATLKCTFSWPCKGLELQKCNLALPQENETRNLETYIFLTL